MKKCMEHIWTRGGRNDLFERCRWCGETRNLGSKPPSSPVETTAGSARPIPPDAANGLTGGPESYADVIRGADEADRVATIADLWDVIEANGATNSRLMRERDEARAMIATDDIELQAKDATISRLWAQLNEATNVPPIPAGPCQSCDQPASTHYHLVNGGCMNSDLQDADDRRSL